MIKSLNHVSRKYLKIFIEGVGLAGGFSVEDLMMCQPEPGRCEYQDAEMKPRENNVIWKELTGKCCGWLRGGDLNPRPLGYEPNELPDCSTPR